MSLTFLAEFERDPARYMKRLLAEATRRMDEQAEASAKAAEQERYRKVFAERHDPNKPEAA